MFDFETTIAEIESRTLALLEENERLRNSLAEKSKQEAELQKAVENQNILINNLEEQNKILKLRNSLTQKGDSTEIKLKINQLIRTIDKSLALLTKIE